MVIHGQRRSVDARLDSALSRATSAAGGASSASARSASPDIDLAAEEARLLRLARRRPSRRDGLYGAPRHAPRARPAELVPGTVRVISARMDYWPADARRCATTVLDGPHKAYVSRYALGRDYHKVMRSRLCAARRRGSPPRSGRSAIACSPTAHRCSRWRSPRRRASAGAASTRCCSRARRARTSSSARSTPTCRCRSAHRSDDHCGTCTALPRRLPDRRDRRALRARRAALHLLSHHRARTAAFPRRCARSSAIASTAATTASSPARGTASRKPRAKPISPRVRHGLDDADLVALFAWTAAEFDERMRGSAIRRIGYERWLRNLAVGLGNAPGDPRRRRGAARARGGSVAARARARRVGAARHEAAMGDGRQERAACARRSPIAYRRPRQRISWFIDTIGSITASTSTSTIAPISDDQHRLDQRREPGQPALGLALELAGGALEHRRQRPALLAVRDQMDQHRRKHLLLLERARQRHALAHQRARGVRRARERQHPDDVARRLERAQERRAAADQDRERAREARGVEARAAAARRPAAAAAHACQRARNGGRRSADDERDDRRGRSAASQSHPVARKKSRRRDQRTRQPGQRLPALLVDRHDLRHDVGQQHRDDAERDRS